MADLAEAIDNRIRMSEAATGNRSKIAGKGRRIVELGRKHNVDPTAVVAIMQKECQLAADGSTLPEKYNNFGGLTSGGGQLPGTCGSSYFNDREWQVYCTPDDGLEGMFVFLNKPLYRRTGGRLEDIMKLYSPPFENEWGPMWETIAAVGSQLGRPLDKNTNIFNGLPPIGVPTWPDLTPGNPVPGATDWLGDWLAGKVEDEVVGAVGPAALRVALGTAGLGLVVVGVAKISGANPVKALPQARAMTKTTRAIGKVAKNGR